MKKYIFEILTSTDRKKIDALFEEAFFIRKKFLSNKVWIRAIIEFSNYCIRNCLYCGLRRDNKNLIRYRMTKQEVIDLAKKIIDTTGIKTIVLQSGDDYYYKEEDVCEIIAKIKSFYKEVAITLSIGERNLEEYKSFKQAGADRYLLKHETANEQLYNVLHPGQNFTKRKEILLYLKSLNYQIGAGNIVGLPGQTIEDLADDILFMKKIGIDMAGIGPFIPQKDTPLANHKKGNFELTLKVLALTRIFTKVAHLPATTASISYSEDKIENLKRCFLAGADVVMLNFTPQKHYLNYKIYDSRKKITLEEIKNAAEQLNLELSFERGDALTKCNLQLQKV